MKWGWREGVEHDANPNILRACWTFLIYIFLHQLRKQFLEYTLSNPGEICRHLALVLAIQSHPWDSDILLLHAKTSRETIAISLNLLRKCVSEKFSIINFLNKEKTLLQFWFHWQCCQKPQPLVNIKKDEKKGGKKRKVHAHPLLNADNPMSRCNSSIASEMLTNSHNPPPPPHPGAPPTLLVPLLNTFLLSPSTWPYRGVS